MNMWDWDRIAASPWRADMRLGEAIQILYGEPYACACIGPPWGSPRGTPCWCALTVAHARAVHRAAHIAARLILDAAETPGIHTGCRSSSAPDTAAGDQRDGARPPRTPPAPP